MKERIWMMFAQNRSERLGCEDCSCQLMGGCIWRGDYESMDEMPLRFIIAAIIDVWRCKN